MSKEQIESLSSDPMYNFVKKNVKQDGNLYNFSFLGTTYQFKTLTMSDFLGVGKISKNTNISPEVLLVARGMNSMTEAEFLNQKAKVTKILEVAFYQTLGIFEPLEVKDNKATINGTEYEFKELSASEEDIAKKEGEFAMVSASLVSPKLTNDEIKKLPLQIGIKIASASARVNELPDFL